MEDPRAGVIGEEAVLGQDVHHESEHSQGGQAHGGDGLTGREEGVDLLGHREMAESGDFGA